MVVTFSGRWNQQVQIQGGTKCQTEEAMENKNSRERGSVCVWGGGGGGSRANQQVWRKSDLITWSIFLLCWSSISASPHRCLPLPTSSSFLTHSPAAVLTCRSHLLAHFSHFPHDVFATVLINAKSGWFSASCQLAQVCQLLSPAEA